MRQNNNNNKITIKEKKTTNKVKTVLFWIISIAQIFQDMEYNKEVLYLRAVIQSKIAVPISAF